MSLISELLSLKNEAEEHHEHKHHHKKGDVVKHSQTNAVGMVMGGLYNGFYPVAVLGGGMQHWEPQHCDPHTPSPADAEHANNPPAPPPPEGTGGPGGPGPAGGAPSGGGDAGGGGGGGGGVSEELELNESAGDQMKKNALAMKREGNMRGYYKQMIKYAEHMADAGDFNARSRFGQGSAQSKKYEKDIAKYKQEIYYLDFPEKAPKKAVPEEVELDEMRQLNLLHGDVEPEQFYLAYHLKPGKKDWKLFVAKPFDEDSKAHKELERLKKKFANDDDKMDTLYAVSVQRGSTLMRAGVSECQGETVQEAFNDHRAFKRKELEFELGHETRASSRPMPKYSGATASEKFGIEIDGKLWKKDGKPVSFTSKGTAEKSAGTIAGRGKKTKVVPITEAMLKEDPAIQALGRGLKPSGTVPPSTAVAGDETDNANDVTAVNTPPAQKQANDATVDADVDSAETTPQYKVGDKVVPNAGPHKGQVHSVIHVFPDGRLNLTPDNVTADQNKYRLGAVTAQPNQVALQEGLVTDKKKPLKYEDPKGFGRKLFNKAMGIPSGPYKYKVGDTVSYVMQPDQKDGSGSGKITKLLDGHHYLINGKPVNQNEIKKRIAEDLMMAVNEAISSVDPEDQYVIVMDREGTKPQYYVGPSKRKSPDGMHSHGWSAGLDKAKVFDTMKDVAVAMQDIDREDPAVRVDGIHGRGAKYKMQAKLLSNLKMDD